MEQRQEEVPEWQEKIIESLENEERKEEGKEERKEERLPVIEEGSREEESPNMRATQLRLESYRYEEAPLPAPRIAQVEIEEGSQTARTRPQERLVIGPRR